jgi:glycosyltransferase involved in cell wall biosynthesis
MMVGLPIVGLATTEMATAIDNHVTGYVDTNIDVLVERMLELCDDGGRARKLGLAARRYARRRFGIERFARDWENTFADVAGTGAPRAEAEAVA